MLIINSNTQLYCIFGKPVKHSLSPVMQNAAFRSLNIDAVYLAFEVENIGDAISSMRTLNIRGASITIPFKRDAMEHIDIIDPLARDIGSINTLLYKKDKITGYNTDGYGALLSLIDNNIEVKGLNILIIGNGGSARAISFTLINEGANIIIAGRNINRILPLINDIEKSGKKTPYTLIKDISLEFMQDIDIIINTTSVGMTPAIDQTPLHKDLILKKHIIFDIVYSPNTTKLLQIGITKGSKIIHGIEMLINQGVKQFQIWTDQRVSYEIMKKAIKKQLK